MCHVSCVTCYMSHVMCHPLPVACHLSPVTCIFFLFFFFLFFLLQKIGQSCGAGRWRVCCLEKIINTKNGQMSLGADSIKFSIVETLNRSTFANTSLNTGKTQKTSHVSIVMFHASHITCHPSVALPCLLSKECRFRLRFI